MILKGFGDPEGSCTVCILDVGSFNKSFSVHMPQQRQGAGCGGDGKSPPSRVPCSRGQACPDSLLQAFDIRPGAPVPAQCTLGSSLVVLGHPC